MIPQAPHDDAEALFAIGRPEAVTREAGPRHAKRARSKTASVRSQRFMVLASGPDDVCALDLRTKALVRLRFDVRAGPRGELKAFDIVDAEFAADPERDDLAQPEAVTISGHPEVVGTTSKHHAAGFTALSWHRQNDTFSGSPGPQRLTGSSAACVPRSLS